MPQNKRTLKGVLGGFVGLVALSAVAGVLVTATVTPAIAMTGLTGSQGIQLFEDLPTDLQVDAPMEATTIWAKAADGSDVKLASFYDQNRVPVNFDQVARVLYDAILSSEDKDFYEHGGINIASTVSAMIDYVQRKSNRGASTISQQYVKNVLVQRCERDVSPSEEDYATKLQNCWIAATNAKGTDGLERKLQEMRYAIQIEKDYSKNEILLGYLNLSNFGGTTYGIEAAAQYYFGVSAANLNLNQAATLAGMVQNPNQLRIDRPEGTWTDKQGVVRNTAESGYKDSLTRRNYVLDRMLADGKITQEQYDTTHAEPITPNITPASQGCVTAGKSAYFCQYVKSIIESDPAFGETADERRETLRRSGLDIYTTLNLDLQQAAIDAISDNVPARLDGIEVGAAGVSVEVGTGRVLAMAQNTDFSETETAPGVTSLVYASDKAHGGGVGFSAGSTYKLFTLLDWLEKGRSVNEVLNGNVRVFSPFKVQGETLTNSTKITNSNRMAGYTGSVMRFTAASLNTGFLAMAQKLDLYDINAMADRLGAHLGGVDPRFNSDLATAQNVPNNVIGDKNIAPLAIAGAYATVAGKGIYCTPRAIDKIVKQDGSEMALPESSCEQVISPEVAATAAYALKGVMSGGTGAQGNPYDGTQLIGKTGTHERTQTMLAESSTKVSTAVWVGNANGNVDLRRYGLTDDRFSLGRRIQGAANRIYGGDAFPAPDKNLTRRVLSTLPNVVGMSIDDATKRLKNAGFDVSVGDPVDSTESAGTVAVQTPGAGRAASGTTVTIQASTGKAPATGATTVTGKKYEDGKKQLEDAGYNVISPSCENGETITAVTPDDPPPDSTVVVTC